MKRILIASLVLLSIAFGGGYLLTSNAIDSAQAEGAASVDAGLVTTTTDLAVIPAGGSAVAPPGSVLALPDVTVTQPQIVIKTVRDVREREGLWAAVAASLFMLLTALRSLKHPAFDFLKQGRTPAIIAGLTGILGAGYEYLTGYLSFYAVIAAVMVTAVALVNAVFQPKAEPAK